MTLTKRSFSTLTSLGLQRTRLFFLLMALFIGPASKSFSQTTVQRLDTFFHSLERYDEINGNVLAAENGSVIYKRSFGFADFENRIPNQEHTKFTLASVSKVFTAAAILQLKDKGRLKLDDPFIKYFPGFPYPEITIRNLLSHTSGLPDYELYEKEIKENPDKVFTIKDIIPSLQSWKKPLSAAPGTQWEYSNTNFCLLALLVEKISGLSFQDYVRNYIFTPAKMSDTFFQPGLSPSDAANRALNYEYPFLFSAKYQQVDSLKRYRWRLYNVSGFVGQGNIITTTADLLKFDNMLYTGKLLKQSTLEEAFTPTKQKDGQPVNAGIGIGKASYGLGWFIFDDTSQGKIVWHTGGQPGSLSIFLRNITKKQAVIMFDNAFHRTLYKNAVNVMSLLNNRPVINYKKSVAKVYGSTLTEKGADAGYCKFIELRADSLHYYLDEEELNDLGLQLLYAATFEHHNELSLEVLKLTTLLFPGSFNTYDSYGEALARVGKTEEAIAMYKKSLELNPKNTGGQKALQELLKK